MRSLSRLKGILGLSHILITLGFLTSHITASCTSQYHQQHKLHISGNTVEQHDVFNTFSSILQIMLIAKKQMITMIDDQLNIVISRPDCKIIGDGLSYRQIHKLNSSYDAVAKLSRDIIVGDQIMVTGDTSSTLVSLNFYGQMLSTLDLQYSINMSPTADHALIVVRSGSDNIVTNYDDKVYMDREVMCYISQDYLNLNNIIIPSLRQLHQLFNDILAAGKIFPQVLNIAAIQDCLGLKRLKFWPIMQMNEQKLEDCLQEHGGRKRRNILAWLDGSQVEIDAVANALDETIDTFNADLLEIESFNRQVVSGYNHLQDEMSDVEEYINSLRDVVILEEIKSEVRERKAFYYRMRMTQAINFNNLVVNSDTSETLQIINNCVYGHLTCTISLCETSLHCGIAQDSNGMNVLEIHREFAQLHNSEGYLINCEPVSSTHISSWHGLVAAGYGNNSLVLHKKIVSLTDLSVDSIVNAEVRPIRDKEKVLENFIILPSKIICLDYVEAFHLDGKLLKCDSLESIEVDSNYTLVYGNDSYTHLQKTLSHKKRYTLEKGIYREMSNEISNFEGNAYDSFVQTVFLNKIGKVSHEKSSAFGVGMFVVVVLIFSLVYWKCACCRNNIESCCLHFMPDCYHVWREKRALAKLRSEEERADRLHQLDPERVNVARQGIDERPSTSARQEADERPGTSARQGIDERYMASVYDSDNETHPGHHAVLPGAGQPAMGSTTW